MLHIVFMHDVSFVATLGHICIKIFFLPMLFCIKADPKMYRASVCSQTLETHLESGKAEPNTSYTLG